MNRSKLVHLILSVGCLCILFLTTFLLKEYDTQSFLFRNAALIVLIIQQLHMLSLHAVSEAFKVGAFQNYLIITIVELIVNENYRLGFLKQPLLPTYWCFYSLVVCFITVVMGLKYYYTSKRPLFEKIFTFIPIIFPAAIFPYVIYDSFFYGPLYTYTINAMQSLWIPTIITFQGIIVTQLYGFLISVFYYAKPTRFQTKTRFLTIISFIMVSITFAVYFYMPAK